MREEERGGGEEERLAGGHGGLGEGGQGRSACIMIMIRCYSLCYGRM